jgi:hypothetical protein
MGRLIVSMNMSLDGYISAQAPDDGSWLRIDEEVHRSFNELAAGADAFLYGRKVFEAMIPYWPDAIGDATKPAYEREYGRLWVAWCRIAVLPPTPEPDCRRCSAVRNRGAGAPIHRARDPWRVIELTPASRHEDLR